MRSSTGVFISIESVRATEKQRRANKAKRTNEEVRAYTNRLLERKMCVSSPKLQAVALFKKVDSEDFPEEYLDPTYWTEYITVYATTQSPACDRSLCMEQVSHVDVIGGLICAAGAAVVATRNAVAGGIAGAACLTALLYIHFETSNNCANPPSGWNCD